LFYDPGFCSSLTNVELVDDILQHASSWRSCVTFVKADSQQKITTSIPKRIKLIEGARQDDLRFINVIA
jgi:hypothetical protein